MAFIPIAGHVAAKTALTANLVVPGGTVLQWTASPSADIDHYHIYRSGTDGIVNPHEAPYAETEETTYVDTDIPLTGILAYLVRAVDSGGIEESNIAMMACLFMVGGESVIAFPCEPRAVTAEPGEAGVIAVKWLYNPRKEEGGPGAAHEARVYWDAGTGTVDFTTPKATVLLSHPLTASWWSWTSEALVDEATYKFVVRIATAAWPVGWETQNVDEHSATVSTATPGSPTLSADVV